MRINFQRGITMAKKSAPKKVAKPVKKAASKPVKKAAKPAKAAPRRRPSR